MVELGCEDPPGINTLQLAANAFLKDLHVPDVLLS
jgi:hypothetical protein